MDTTQQRKVKTLSDQAEMRTAQWVDQASLLQDGRPEEHRVPADIDSRNGSPRQAVAGTHSAGAFLFDDLQPAGNGAGSKTSASTSKRRTGVRSVSAVRDRVSSRDRDSSTLVGSAAKTKVMTAELLFAKMAKQDDAALRKHHRQADASLYTGTQASRRSSLPTPSPKSSKAPEQNQLESLTVQAPQRVCHQKRRQIRVVPECVVPEWRETWQANLDRALPTVDAPEDSECPQNPEGPFQNLSQLLAKPEVGGYLVMGALIACTFLI
ncbi:MAG: hypothetical protein GY930_02040 [bacterium]|nr:hypothetical protein [bacterium]